MKARRSSTAAPRGSGGWWLDPRLIIGIVLVVASVLGVLFIVSAADGSIRVYAAREPIIPGQTVDESDLIALSVRLDGAADHYLLAGELPDGGAVATKAVSAGELIPASAIGSADGVRLASVVLTPTGAMPASVVAGSFVDLWSAEETDTGTFGIPTVLVAGGTVVRLIDPEGIIASGKGRAVEVLVPRARLGRALEAIANGDTISLVPVSIPVKG